ncbi:exodeoxyribonuclease VII small subunit [Minwuia thermotolerans]|jgi:exodeoxyribonuclease VII small subunit|uniref:Exodeoxyribonuclease 7 small subunit n=1 Tax=Minwuia thermotolerans TaxID=2056226 RepID=A0A2M9G2V4_9PROT|nr:exodeoxyribonuclease VII small subunit [Minwuia thermotolerans]ANK80604.1 MAG: exodeoxyribonuclease VII small subunit [Rhizobiales bacterium NRL2]PJK30052.1 exodeoxyribonuclease VII small subunit [Minwuia thermotolerans]
MTEIPDDIRQMNFETALQELEKIVGRLESGDVDLEDSIDMYARGVHLKAHCEAKLKAAEARVEKLVIGTDGQPAGSEPFETE